MTMASPRITPEYASLLRWVKGLLGAGGGAGEGWMERLLSAVPGAVGGPEVVVDVSAAVMEAALVSAGGEGMCVVWPWETLNSGYYITSVGQCLCMEVSLGILAGVGSAYHP